MTDMTDHWSDFVSNRVTRGRALAASVSVGAAALLAACGSGRSGKNGTPAQNQGRITFHTGLCPKFSTDSHLPRPAGICTIIHFWKEQNSLEMRPPDKRGWWCLLSLVSPPLLFLARTGLFGKEARDQSEVALGDGAAYGKILLKVLATIVSGVVVGVVIIVLYSLIR